MMVEITKGKSKSLHARKVEYINDIPEYPSTHKDGYCYVVFLSDPSMQGAENMVSRVGDLISINSVFASAYKVLRCNIQ